MLNEKVMSDEEHQIIDKITKVDDHTTQEEFDNFMIRVTEVEKIVKKLASADVEEQECGMVLADNILSRKNESQINENEDLTTKSNRTIINKTSLNDLETDANKMSQEAFMRSVERDAQQRAENRKIRNERAETYKRIGNAAFKEGNYEKAVTYFTKAVEQRKDSAVLWNNRALAYIKLSFYEKALVDCEWALKVNDSNIKALLNAAKCYYHLKNLEKYQEFISRAKDSNPHFSNFITEFESKIGMENQNS